MVGCIEGLTTSLVSVSKFYRKSLSIDGKLLAMDGQFSDVFGTSASAPVVASMITLINDARIASGKNSVGFLNPAVCFPHSTAGL